MWNILDFTAFLTLDFWTGDAQPIVAMWVFNWTIFLNMLFLNVFVFYNSKKPQGCIYPKFLNCDFSKSFVQYFLQNFGFPSI